MMGFGVLGSPWNSDGGSEFRNVCGGLHFRFWGLGMARMGLGFLRLHGMLAVDVVGWWVLGFGFREVSGGV